MQETVKHLAEIKSFLDGSYIRASCVESPRYLLNIYWSSGARLLLDVQEASLSAHKPSR